MEREERWLLVMMMAMMMMKLTTYMMQSLEINRKQEGEERLFCA